MINSTEKDVLNIPKYAEGTPNHDVLLDDMCMQVKKLFLFVIYKECGKSTAFCSQ